MIGVNQTAYNFANSTLLAMQCKIGAANRSIQLEKKKRKERKEERLLFSYFGGRLVKVAVDVVVDVAAAVIVTQTSTQSTMQIGNKFATHFGLLLIQIQYLVFCIQHLIAQPQAKAATTTTTGSLSNRFII